MVGVIAVASLIVLALLLLHTGFVQNRVLQWSVGELERRFDLDLTAESLRFNLVTRRVVMRNVRLTAVGHRDDPFFTASRVTVRLPWAAYRGRLHFEEIGVEDGAVTVFRDADGVSNLPPGRGPARDPEAPPRRLDVRGLTVRNLDFSYRDAQRDIEILAPQIRTDFTYEAGRGASGPMAIEQPLLVRVGARRSDIQPVQAQVVFDGSNVELAGMNLDTIEGNFVVDGEITRVLDGPILDLAFTGTADIEQGARWATPPIHLAGTASVEATMTGPPTEFVLDSHVVAPGAEVGLERNVRIDAESRLTPDGIAVSRSTITPAAGGEVRATADVPFGDDAPWWIEAEWRGLEAASAFRLAEVTPLPFGAALAGHARIARQPGEPFSLRVQNVSAPRDRPGAAPLEGTVDFLVSGNRWQADQRHRMGATRVAGPVGGVWNREDVVRSTFEGTLDVETADVGEAARHAALFGLTTPALVRNASGPMEATVTLDGTFTEPRFIGTAQSPGVQFPPVGTVAFSAEFDASERALSATDVDATIRSGPLGPGSRLLGHVHADLVTRRLAGEFTLDASARDLMTGVPDALRLEGPLSAVAVLGGTVDAPDIAVDVTGRDLTLAGQIMDSLDVRARVIDDGITVDSLRVRQDGGVLEATGRYDWETETFTADVTGQDLLWRGGLARLGDAEVRFGLRFAGSGPVDRPVGEGAIEFAVAGDIAGALVDRGVATVRLNGETALVTAHVPQLGALLTASFVPRQPFTY
jgi:hypothetical protein